MTRKGAKEAVAAAETAKLPNCQTMNIHIHTPALSVFVVPSEAGRLLEARENTLSGTWRCSTKLEDCVRGVIMREARTTRAT